MKTNKNKTQKRKRKFENMEGKLLEQKIEEIQRPELLGQPTEDEILQEAEGQFIEEIQEPKELEPTEEEIQAWQEEELKKMLEPREPTEEEIQAWQEEYMDQAIKKAQEAFFEDPFIEQVHAATEYHQGETALLQKYTGDRARKTTRTTFSLSAESIQVIALLSDEYGYTPRTIFQEAANMVDSLKDTIDQSSNEKRSDMVRKTFVIELLTLQKFNQVSKQWKISRNRIIELSLKRLKYYLQKVGEYEALKSKYYQAKIRKVTEELEKLIVKTSEDFGNEEHPIPLGIKIAANSISNVGIAIDHFLDTGNWSEDTL